MAVKRLFAVRCPQCKQVQLYSCTGSPKGKRKTCVYCGKTFTVHSKKSLGRSNIVREFLY